jgi:RNA polymerase sigma-70 factor (ECF subfamily)
MRLKALADDAFADFDFAPRVSADDPLPPEGQATGSVGERRPLDTFYEAQAPRLLRYFTRRVGHEEARDLVQEAFASFVGAVTRPMRALDRPEAYLSSIASNLAARHARTAARRCTALHLPIDDVPLAGADPHTHLEARDLLERLEAAMLRLRPLTREIFLAHRLDGYTYREIAERTGLSLKRVEKHMSRAIRQLDDVLGP